ncbi:hypothetical protein C8Q80DRAFT_626251 [Daedaleopsis nitida]|nr:hypothetical protein C8Q80DRAFT_626251 [Daedaleopsis nitida]
MARPSLRRRKDCISIREGERQPSGVRLSYAQTPTADGEAKPGEVAPRNFWSFTNAAAPWAFERTPSGPHLEDPGLVGQVIASMRAPYNATRMAHSPDALVRASCGNVPMPSPPPLATRRTCTHGSSSRRASGLEAVGSLHTLCITVCICVRQRRGR